MSAVSLSVVHARAIRFVARKTGRQQQRKVGDGRGTHSWLVDDALVAIERHVRVLSFFPTWDGGWTRAMMSHAAASASFFRASRVIDVIIVDVAATQRRPSLSSPPDAACTLLRGSRPLLASSLRAAR